MKLLGLAGEEIIMISRFTQYLVEEERVAYFVFATMNPPHINDGKLLDKLAKTAGKVHIWCTCRIVLMVRKIRYHIQIK